MESQYKRLTDSQWEVVQASLPVERKRKHSLRVIADAIFYMLRVGGQWRNLPEELFPKWQLVYYYFHKRQADGTLESLNWRLNIRERERQGKEASPRLLSIDLQSVKAAPFVSQETGVDGNKKVNGRKRHGITDTLGLVWGVVVHSADGALAQRVVAPLRGYLHRMEKILADAAYEKGVYGVGEREPAGGGVGDKLQTTRHRGLCARQVEMGHQAGFGHVQLLQKAR